MKNPIPNAIRVVIIGGWAITLVWLERKRALRAVHDSKLRRDLRNLTVAATAGTVMQVLEIPIAFQLAQVAQQWHWGLLPQSRLVGAAGVAVGVLLLDYTLYWWHFLTHRVPVLWRFHQVHHIDREMDATTALRFHFGEIAISVIFRGAQMIAIGPTPFAVALWQVFLFVCILFHHSNMRLPIGVERRLARFVVTPRLHGIHHSIAPEQVNSNWSSGLTVWDWMHATLRTDVPQDEIVIGVPGYLDDTKTELPDILLLPFRESGSVPEYKDRSVRESLDLLR